MVNGCCRIGLRGSLRSLTKTAGSEDGGEMGGDFKG